MEKCVFCGLSASQKFYIDDKNKLSAWSKACFTSICALFRIHNSHPIHQQLRNSPICASCRQLALDTDFSLRLLDKFLSQVEQCREQLLQRVETNSARITENGKDDHQDLVISIATKFRKESATINAGLERFKVLLNLPSLRDNKFNNNIRQRVKNNVNLKLNQHPPQDEEQVDEKGGMILMDIQVKEESLDEIEYYDDDHHHVIMEDTDDLEADLGNTEDIHGDRKYLKVEVEEAELDGTDNDRTVQECPLCDFKSVSARGLILHSAKGCHKKKTTTDDEDEIDQEQDEEQQEDEHAFHDSDENDEDINDYIPIKKKKRKVKPSCSTSSSANTIPCPLCPAKFPTTKSLAVHSRVHKKNAIPQNQDKRTCKLCGLKINQADLLSAHEEEHLTIGGGNPFTCTICGIATPNSSQLQRHVFSTHARRGTHLCDICGANFQSAAYLTSHCRLHATDPSQAQFPCKTCGYIAGNRAALEMHSSKHLETKSFICETCGKGFKYKKGLVHHRASHDKVLSWKCAICEKGFTHRRYLLQHEVSHSGLLPYGCKHPGCGRKFKAKASKYQHESFHCPQRTDRGKVSAFKRKKNEQMRNDDYVVE